jgi:anti-anti-sigma factor
MSLELSTRRVGDIVVITCRGRIVAGPATLAIHTQVKEAFTEAHAVVLQVADVDFIDSSGLGTLVRLHAGATSTGSRLKLCAPSPMVRKVLQFTNLHRLFEIYESETEAVSAYYERAPASDPEPPRARIVCLDGSPETLACLREVLRAAGYHVLTSSNLPDAQLLLKATKVQAVIVGQDILTAQPDATARLHTRINPDISLIALGSDFSQQEAGDAAHHLLNEIKSRLAS